jgi:hypothetical protein
MISSRSLDAVAWEAALTDGVFVAGAMTAAVAGGASSSLAEGEKTAVADKTRSAAARAILAYGCSAADAQRSLTPRRTALTYG